MPLRAAESVEPVKGGINKLIAPAVSTGTGLLLEPALTLPEFTREKFVAAMNTVGPEKIHKPWTNPVVVLPPHPRAEAKGLTHDEVKAYMTDVKRLFDTGKAVPTSEVGLISTQEDVIRKPMLNHIAAFSNSTVRAYLLVQKTATDKGWSYFTIVQDLTVSPVLDYFAEIKKDRSEVRGDELLQVPFLRSARHPSGPRGSRARRAARGSDQPAHR